VRYSEVGQTVIAAASDKVSYLGEAFLGSAYLFVGQPERYLEVCRAQLTRRGDTHTFARANLVLALAVSGSTEEAMLTATGLIDAAEASGNPWVLAYTLFVCGGFALRDTDPGRALEALRRSLGIAQDSGNRLWETQVVFLLSGLEAVYGDPLTALDYVTVAIRNHHESGNIGMLRNPLAVLAAFLDRLGRYEPAATIAGFALSPFTASTVPQLSTAVTHLRDVLGDQTYESLARKGETMTTTAVVTYAYDQIDQARTELEHRS
jgi:hypothetical protein